VSAEAARAAAHAITKAPARPVPSRGHTTSVEPGSLATLGNQQAQMLLRRGLVHPKLEIGQVDDPEEREADAVADRVMRMPDGGCCPASATGGSYRVDTIRSKPAGSGTTVRSAPSRLHASMERLTRGGQSLSPQTRAFFEPRFGRDLGNVRIHTEPVATDLARALGAKAFAFGPHIAFAAGQFAPDRDEGRHLLAHELAHTANGFGPLRRRFDMDVETSEERAERRRAQEAEAARHFFLLEGAARLSKVAAVAGDVLQVATATNDFIEAFNAIQRQPGMTDEQRHAAVGHLVRSALLTGTLLTIALKGDIAEVGKKPTLHVTGIDEEGRYIVHAEATAKEVPASADAALAGSPHPAPHAEVQAPVHAHASEVGSVLTVAGQSHAVGVAGRGPTRGFYFCSDFCAKLAEKLTSILACLPPEFPGRNVYFNLRRRARTASNRLAGGLITDAASLRVASPRMSSGMQRMTRCLQG
jgi:hypothetical protein